VPPRKRKQEGLLGAVKGLFNRAPKVQKVDLRKRFDLVGRVGQGSMSKVWRARDLTNGRMVALKLLDPMKTRRFEARFEGLNKPSEGEIAVQLRHPHIVQTFEHGVSLEGYQFLVMEFIEGISLSYLVDTQNEQMQQHRLRFIIELGSAIEYLHRENWIHRDICPRNVILDQEGGFQAKLIDFGLVVPNTEMFRRPGNRTGTASYMAPELIKRLRTDQRIDIFSFSVGCYEMYTRRHPWQSGPVTIEMVLQHINHEPLDIRKVGPPVDDQVADAIMRGLERDPDRRWRSMNEMLQPLRQAHRRLNPEEPELTWDPELDPDYHASQSDAGT
jgi:serine/threonine protein kinase